MSRIFRPAFLAALTAIWLHAGAPAAFAQSTFTVDPTEPLVNPISLGEWNTEGDAEGWNANQFESPVVAAGTFSGTTNGGDPTFSRAFPEAYLTGQLSIVTLDVRLRRAASDTSTFQVFWSDNGGNFIEARSATLPAARFPTDGEFHTVRLVIRTLNNNLLNGSLKAIRIDPGQSSGTAVDFDYVRLSVISGGFVQDPLQLVNAYTSVGEWNTAGNLEGWTAGGQILNLAAASGLLSGTSNGVDPTLNRGGLAPLAINAMSAPIVEIRMRKRNDDTSRIDLFWADEAGGIAAARRATTLLAPPNDGQFHVYQTSLGAFLTGNLAALRLDPVADIPSERPFDIDYVRFGSIAPDADNDGLADVVETNTGAFVSSRDTGTKPGVADSDVDGFSDGVELSYGTDPNNASDRPTPGISGYTVSPANYLRGEPIANNPPVITNGNPVSFSITPALPPGLVFNTATGAISGTPSALSPATPYTITANFSGGVTSTFELLLAVRDPSILSYTLNNGVYIVGASISPNSPTLFGPAPDFFSVDPALPDGLLLDPFTGTISGTPTIVVPNAVYTITADYFSSPDATFPLNIRVRKSPVYAGTDNPPLTSYFSLGEFETGIDGWGAANATATVGGGNVTIVSTAVDPQLGRGGLAVAPDTAGTLLEIRLRQTEASIIEIFWGDASGGIAASRRFEVNSSQVLADGQFHTYQVSFDGVFEGNVTQLRIDPGVSAGRTVEIDYIRLGFPAAPAPLAISGFSYDPVFREATITWNSISGRSYTLQSSPTLTPETSWMDIATNIFGDPGTTSYIDNNIPAGTTRRFYRVVLQP